MKSIISVATIFCLFSIVLNACCDFKFKSPDGALEPDLSTYWDSDSLSTNGFKDLASLEILLNKKKFIGKDTEHMIGLLGQPTKKTEQRSKIVYYYRVLDVRGGGKTLAIIFDRSTQKVVNIKRYHDKG